MDGLIFLTRDRYGKVVPFTNNIEKEGTTICIRSGQLIDHKLYGIGRKIILNNPVFDKDDKVKITDFSSAAL